MTESIKVTLISIITLLLPFNKLKAGDSLSSYCKVRILPIVYYTPETRVAFGGLAYFQFKFNQSDSLTRRSSIQSYLTYTQNHQFGIENDWQIFSNGEKFNCSGELSYTRFPEYFFGIGNFSDKEQRELYNFDLFKIKAKSLARIYKKLFAGFYFHYQFMSGVIKQDAPQLSSGEIPGACGHNVGGIGTVVKYDSRDLILNPQKGSFIEVSSAFYNSLDGAKYGFVNYTFDLRKYSQLYSSWILASNLYVNLNSGILPFRMMPFIGGARIMRGYYAGRFRDRNLFHWEEEIRAYMNKRIGFVMFGGIAQVTSSLSELMKLEYFKYHFGAGVRVKIHKEDKTNLRIDYGIGQEGNGLYIVLAEAF